jgi:drug/metabolite transporter (DMT)-like permease
MEHVWIVFGLLSAFSLATNNALLKKMFAKHNEYVVTWLTYFVATILVLIAVFYGFILFKESGIEERFPGASMMLGGFTMLAFAA